MPLRIVLIFFGLLAAFSTYGQIQKGGIIVGGNGMAYFDTHERVYVDNFSIVNGKARYFGFNINPNISYFIYDRLSVGIVSSFGVNYDNYVDQFHSTPISSSTSLRLGPNVRYYIPYKRWAVFPELQYVGKIDFHKKIRLNPETNLYAANRYREHQNDFQIGIGGLYFLTSDVALEGVFQFNGIIDPEPGNLQTHYRIYSFNVGIQFFLTK